MNDRGDGEQLADIARVLADASRATMALALLDGRAWTAAELGARAGIARSTATGHINVLVRSGIAAERRAGRHRYVSLAGPNAAEALEALSRLIRPLTPSPSLRAVHADRALRGARRCYDHLAGSLGTAMLRFLRDDDLIRPGRSAGESAGRIDFSVTARGDAWCAELGIDVDRLRAARRPLAFACLDWTERQDHLAGGLGAAILGRSETLGWLGRRADSRAIRVFPEGAVFFREQIGWEAPGTDRGARPGS